MDLSKRQQQQKFKRLKSKSQKAGGQENTMKKIIDTYKLDETIKKLSNTVSALTDAYVFAPVTTWDLGDTIESARNIAGNQLADLVQLRDLLDKIPAELGLIEDCLEEEDDDIDWEFIDSWFEEEDDEEEA